jgi:peptide/nickel transport system substrate-binding protein
VGSALLLMAARGPRALAQTQASAQPQYGGTLKVSLLNEIKTLDPTFQTTYNERFVMYVMFNTLFSLGRDSSIGPELAESWSFEDDGRRLVLHLRTGVTFHDGTVFDADAVKWNFEHRMSKEINSPSRSLLSAVIDGVDATDQHTVVIRLKGPTPSILGMLAQRDGWMVSPTSATKLGPDFGHAPVGTGPFVFKQWDQGSRIVLEKNKAYWNPGKPYLDRIEYVLTQNSLVGIPRLFTGEVDVVAPLSPLEIRPLESRRDIKVEQRPVSRWVALQFRIDRPPFDNLKLRQAIAYGLDRKRIADITMAGKAVVAEGSVPPGLWWFDPDLKSYPFDPAKAKALLTEIGHPNGIEITLTSSPDDPVYQQIALLVQDQLKAVGITVKIQPIASSEFYTQVVQGKIAFSPTRWAARPDPDGLFSLLFDSKSGSDSTAYNNPEVDALLAKARGLRDQEERKQVYFQAQRIMTHDLPYVPLFFQPEYAAMRSDVGNGQSVWVADEAPRFRDLWKSRS